MFFTLDNTTLRPISNTFVCTLNCFVKSGWKRNGPWSSQLFKVQKALSQASVLCTFLGLVPFSRLVRGEAIVAKSGTNHL